MERNRSVMEERLRGSFVRAMTAAAGQTSGIFRENMYHSRECGPGGHHESGKRCAPGSGVHLINELSS